LRSYQAVVFDIETTAIRDAADYIEPAVAPANYKDTEKIAAWVAEKREERIRRAALDPDLARVVCLSMETGGVPFTQSAPNDQAEADLITAFWDVVPGRTLVGFGILTYDLRVLFRRSLYLGIRAPRILMERYRHPDVIDLMDVLSYNGAESYHSLDFYVRRFGLGPFEPDISGSSVSACIAAGDWQTVETHCAIDVRKTKALAERMGILDQEPQAA